MFMSGDMVWKLTSAMFWFKTSDNGAVQILKVYILRIQIGTIYVSVALSKQNAKIESVKI